VDDINSKGNPKRRSLSTAAATTGKIPFLESKVLERRALADKNAVLTIPDTIVMPK
jgi:hypothetical protein